MRCLRFAALTFAVAGISTVFAASYDDGSSYSSRNCYYDSYGNYVCDDSGGTSYRSNRDRYRSSDYDRTYRRSDYDRGYRSRDYNGRGSTRYSTSDRWRDNRYDTRDYNRSGGYRRGSRNGVGVDVGGMRFGIGTR